MTVTLEEIRQAAELIRGDIEETPCIRSRTLSEIVGAEVVIKFENLQFTGSFKDRGALVKLLSLTGEERRQGVIAMSAGNHAQAVAYHARRLGIPAVIVMPRFTPTVKVEHTRAYGAEVILHGEVLDEAGVFARSIAEEKGYCLIPPYDDPQIISGQGTVALEMLAAHPDLEALVVPVGGGGLISGNAIAAKGLKPGIEVIGVESARYPSMLNALEGRKPEFGTFTIAEGIAVKEPGRLTLPIIRELVDRIVLVEEEELEQAVLLLLEVEKTVAEGAGAAGLAALLQGGELFKDRKVGLIISGGNIDPTLLAAIIQRGLVRSGRMARIQVDMRDVPGSLAGVTKCLAEAGANIVQVEHHRTFTELPVQLAVVEFVIQTRGLDHAREVAARLRDHGYRACLSPPESECRWG